MADTRDPRTIRLFDLELFESVVVTCRCGWIVSYGTGLLQRRHHLPSDTLVYDLRSSSFVARTVVGVMGSGLRCRTRGMLGRVRICRSRG